jgi:hypothetical protein
MFNATQPPRRMRFSFESRCRLVSLVLFRPPITAVVVAERLLNERRPARGRARCRRRSHRRGDARGRVVGEEVDLPVVRAPGLWRQTAKASAVSGIT